MSTAVATIGRSVRRCGPDGHLREHFLLDPTITFLNHAAYGATPRPVFEDYQRWQRELERQPVDFLSRYSTDRLAQARQVLADFLGTERDNLVYVANGTTGMNIVVRSLALGTGDELLTSDHEHGGIDRLMRFAAEQRGFAVVRREIPQPVTTHEAFIEHFWAGVTPRTRAILLSHLTSPTSLVFPVDAICRRARQAGIVTIIDGSHVPGQLPLALRDLDPDFYVGILHKWVCAPKGCAFLYARPSAQPLLQPLIVSWGWAPRQPGPSRFVDCHEWQGSRDISAFLAAPAAIAFQAEHRWHEVRAECRTLAREAQLAISDLTGVPPYHEDRDEWRGQVVCARLPRDVDADALKTTLRFDYGIEVSTDTFKGWPRIRVSIQAYNTADDVQRLIDALTVLLSASCA